MEKITRATYDEVMMPVYNPLPMVMQRGNGVYLYDTDGNEYLDLSAGIAVNCLGHNHPGIVKTISEQAATLMHVSNIFTNNKTLELALKLTKLTGFEKVFFVNSGTEANEAALKLARRYAYDVYGEQKDEIISFYHSFHGRTFFSVSVGGQDKYSHGFGPKPGAITHLPFNDIDTFSQEISEKTCAVILEPIQGEGGIIEVDPQFLAKVKELCEKYHALLIFDEVQTGMGRTGSLYAYQDLNIKPDILTTSKAIAGGIPCGAVLSTSEIAKHFSLGTHGSTFGGNAFACAVGCYVVDQLSKPEFLQHVKDAGAYLVKLLNELNDKYQIFTTIRGKGLLLGCVMNDKYKNMAGKLQACCGAHKLLVLTASANVLRLTPPLIISFEELDKAKVLFDKAFKDFVEHATQA